MYRAFALAAHVLLTAGAAAQELPRLAERLGDRDYRVREEAGRRLHAHGAAALPTLYKVALSGNIEAGDRAAALIAKIENERRNAQAIAGTFVELEAGERPLGAALTALGQRSGYSFQINGDGSAGSKKVTPKTGRVLFWDAVQALADAAGLEVEPPVAPIPGKPAVVVLRKKGAAPNPVCVAGAFRIEAVPVPAGELPHLHADRVPVMLQIAPEPNVAWVGTLQTLITECRDQDGRSLPWDFTNADFASMNTGQFGQNGGKFGAGGFGGGGNGGNGGFGAFGGNGGFGAFGGNGGGGAFGTSGAGQFGVPSRMAPTPFQAPVKLLAHPGGPSHTLKTFKGLVRGQIWSRTEPLLTLAGLTKEYRSVGGENRSRLEVKCEPLPGDPSASVVSINVTHDTGMRLANGGDPARSAGWVIEDGNGVAMKMSVLSATTATTTRSAEVGADFACVYTAQYRVRPADTSAASQPAKFTLSGSRIIAVEIPFHLKDVPVPRGTNTAR